MKALLQLWLRLLGQHFQSSFREVSSALDKRAMTETGTDSSGPPDPRPREFEYPAGLTDILGYRVKVEVAKKIVVAAQVIDPIIEML